MEASVVDFEGRHWMTGPKTALSVRVYEDTSSTGKAQSASGTGQTVRPGGSSGGTGIPSQVMGSKPRI